MEKGSRYAASSECEVVSFGDGIAILDLRSNTYFTMNATGRFVFEALRTPLTRGEVVEQVAARYNLKPSDCEADVGRLLDDLAAHRLADLS